jgi:hypothetical protein
MVTCPLVTRQSERIAARQRQEHGGTQAVALEKPSEPAARKNPTHEASSSKTKTVWLTTQKSNPQPTSTQVDASGQEVKSEERTSNVGTQGSQIRDKALVAIDPTGWCWSVFDKGLARPCRPGSKRVYRRRPQ